MAPWGLPGSAVLSAAMFLGGAMSSPLVAPVFVEGIIFDVRAEKGLFDLLQGTTGSQDNTGSRTLQSRAETTPSSPTNNAGNGHPEYIAYVLVPVFFIMGLLGVLICHLLKKKGYRCTTEAEQEVEEEKVEKIELNDSINENSDTVGQIVHYIMKNEASLAQGTQLVTIVLEAVSVAVGMNVGARQFEFLGYESLRPFGRNMFCLLSENVLRILSSGPYCISQDSESTPLLTAGRDRFRVTKVEHKSNQKERRSLMSVGGTESVNGDVPVTPVKRDRSGTE
ncbi:RELT-like 1 [Cricetulus griseus]